MITVFNKADLCREEVFYPKISGNKIYISAKEEESLAMLVQMILERIYADLADVKLLIPYEKGSIVSYFRENAHIISQEYEENGTLLVVKCHRADKDKYSQYVIEADASAADCRQKT